MSNEAGITNITTHGIKTTDYLVDDFAALVGDRYMEKKQACELIRLVIDMVDGIENLDGHALEFKLDKQRCEAEGAIRFNMEVRVCKK